MPYATCCVEVKVQQKAALNYCCTVVQKGICNCFNSEWIRRLLEEDMFYMELYGILRCCMGLRYLFYYLWDLYSKFLGNIYVKG